MSFIWPEFTCADDGNFVKLARKMSSKITEFLNTHTIVHPLPRAKDTHIIGGLQGISETDDHDSDTDPLVNYLCQTYSVLRNLKNQDLSSTINDLVIFIKESSIQGLFTQYIIKFTQFKSLMFQSPTRTCKGANLYCELMLFHNNHSLKLCVIVMGWFGFSYFVTLVSFL